MGRSNSQDFENERKGDIAYDYYSDSWDVLHIGTAGQFLWVKNGLPSWHTLVQADVPNIALAAWTGFTPTCTSTVGTLTTVAAVGRYFQISKVLFLECSITVTTNGTGAGAINMPIPAGLTSVSAVTLYGREDAVSGKSLNGVIGASGTSFNIFNYDNSYPGANGAILRVSSTLEVV